MNPDYDFINQQNTTKSNILAGASFKKRIILVSIGFAVLFLLIIIIYSILFGGQKSTSESLFPVGAAQADILELTRDGKSNVRSSQLQNTSSTIAVVVSTHNNETMALIGKNGSKKIAPFQNSEFTQALETAKQAGKYDEAYQAILNTKLDLYQQLLKTAYGEISDIKVKKTLEQQYSQISTIRGEPTTPQD
ncbi:MAG: hypothetical protein MUF85_01140 [Patescibacteria group bacterium]|jgi:hypothetical protein|nr:hypothetical protein [Patescibacteria group bacterium]